MSRFTTRFDPYPSRSNPYSLWNWKVAEEYILPILPSRTVLSSAYTYTITFYLLCYVFLPK